MLAPVVEPDRPSFQLAGAGGTLIGTTAACAILGLLAGWALGSGPIGLMIGVVIGIPVGIFAVYRRYREAM
jgi:F0F1-type ATP synthase assembly protein I